MKTPYNPTADVPVAVPERYQIVHHTPENPAPVANWEHVKRQSKLASAVEAVVNTFVGLLIAFGAQLLIVWVYDIPLSASDNFTIVMWMTVVSVVRSYIIRRAWNSEFWRRK